MSNVIIRLPEVKRRTGLSRSSVYAKISRGPYRVCDRDSLFPKPIPLGARAVGWLESEIDAWVAAKMASRDES